VMMSANPICHAAVHNLDHLTTPALVAGNLPGTGLATVSYEVAGPVSPLNINGPIPSPIPIPKPTPILRAPAAPSLRAYPTYPTSTGGNIALYWNSVSGAAGYLVEVWVPSYFVKQGSLTLYCPAHWQQVASLGSGATSYVFNVGQNISQQFTFRVAATNPAGTTWSTSVSSTAEYTS